MNRNITVTENEDYAHGLRWLDANRTPYALSAMKMQVRATEDPTSTLLVEATTVNGRAILGVAPDHWATILIPAAVLDAVAWPATPAFYDVLLTRQVDGRVRRALHGRIFVRSGTTR